MALRFLRDGYFVGTVGIGTASPDAKLDVRSTSRTAPVVLKLGNGIISGDNGVIVSQIRSYINNSNTAADELARIQVENGSGSHDDGNLSFWTRDGLNNVDDAKQLQINGKGVVDIKNDGTAALPVLIFGADVDTGFYRPSSNNIALSTTGVERIRVTSAGNVGIGDPGPAVKLQVSTNSPTNNIAALIGDGWVGNSDYHKEGALLLISGTSQDATQTGAGIAFQTRNTQNSNYWKSSVIMDRGGAMRFTLGGAGTVAGSEDFTILSGGNVGIGNTAPPVKFAVNNGVVRTSTAKTYSTFVHTNDTDDYRVGLATAIKGGATAGDRYVSLEGSSYRLSTDAFTNEFDLVLNPVAGNVGIGTTSPNEKLEVEGSLRVNRAGSSTQYGIFGQDSNGGFINYQRPATGTLYENFRFIGKPS